MDFDEFKDLVTTLYNSNKRKEAFLNSMPNRVSIFYVDNDYVNENYIQFEKVFKMLMKDMYEDVSWFLNDCVMNRDFTITVNSKSYYINTLEDYLDYAKKELFND